MSDRLGLIAGGGRLPLEIARGVRDRAVCAIGFPGITDPALAGLVSELAWLGLGAVEAVLDTLRRAGVREVVLAGKIDKGDWVRSPAHLEPDATARRILAGLDDRSDPRLMAAIAELLEQSGLLVLPQAARVPHLLPSAGVLGKVEPGPVARRDVALGWSLARRLAASGVGQCLVVKAGHVVAVEAIEGTDATVARAVALAGGGLTVVKVAGPDHDPRFDLPTVGPRTIEPLVSTGGGVLAIEAGATLVLERGRLVEQADRAGIAVLAVGADGPDADGVSP